LSMHRNRKS